MLWLLPECSGTVGVARGVSAVCVCLFSIMGWSFVRSRGLMRARVLWGAVIRYTSMLHCADPAFLVAWSSPFAQGGGLGCNWAETRVMSLAWNDEDGVLYIGGEAFFMAAFMALFGLVWFGFAFRRTK